MMLLTFTEPKTLIYTQQEKAISCYWAQRIFTYLTSIGCVSSNVEYIRLVDARKVDLYELTCTCRPVHVDLYLS